MILCIWNWFSEPSEMDFDSQGNVKYLCSFSSVSGTIQGTLCVYIFYFFLYNYVHVLQLYSQMWRYRHRRVDWDTQDHASNKGLQESVNCREPRSWIYALNYYTMSLAPRLKIKARRLCMLYCQHPENYNWSINQWIDI